MTSTERERQREREEQVTLPGPNEGCERIIMQTYIDNMIRKIDDVLLPLFLSSSKRKEK